MRKKLMSDDFEENLDAKRETQIRDERMEAAVGLPGCLLILAAVITTTIAITSLTNFEPLVILSASLFLVAIPLMFIIDRINTNKKCTGDSDYSLTSDNGKK